MNALSEINDKKTRDEELSPLETCIGWTAVADIEIAEQAATELAELREVRQQLQNGLSVRDAQLAEAQLAKIQKKCDHYGDDMGDQSWDCEKCGKHISRYAEDE